MFEYRTPINYLKELKLTIEDRIKRENSVGWGGAKRTPDLVKHLHRYDRAIEILENHFGEEP